MGLFDLFSKKPTSGKINRLTKRMLNEHHQQQVRQEALDELVAFGTEEAIGALVQRLGVNFRDSIKNEQEKNWVTEVLVNHFGERAIDPLRDFIKSEQTVSAAILTLAQLVESDALVALLIASLEQYRPEDHRSIDARLQLVDALADQHEDERVVPAVLPYAMDHDDAVRVKVIDILEDRVKAGHPQYEETVAQLIEVLEDPEASSRIARRASAALEALEADLSGREDELADVVPDDYAIVEGRMRKK